MKKDTFLKATQLSRQIEFIDNLFNTSLINQGFIRVKTTNYLPEEVYPEIKPIWDRLNSNILENIKVSFSDEITADLLSKKLELEKEFESL